MGVASNYANDVKSAIANISYHVSSYGYGGDDSQSLASDGKWIYWNDDSGNYVRLFTCTRSSLSYWSYITLNGFSYGGRMSTKAYVRGSNIIAFFDDFNSGSRIYGYMPGQQNFSGGQTVGFTGTINDYMSVLGHNLIVSSNNTAPWVAAGYNDGFWIARVINSSLTAQSLGGYNVFMAGNNFAGATIRFEKRRYTDLALLRSVDVVLPSSGYRTTAIFGGEGSSSGFELKCDLLVAWIGDTAVGIDIEKGTVLFQQACNWTGDGGADATWDPVQNVFIHDSGDTNTEVLYLHTVPWDMERYAAYDNTKPSASTTSPKGTMSAPATVATLTPQLSWSYSDPEGNAQSAYQVRVVNGHDGSDIKWDTGKVLSGNTSVTVPANILQPNTLYAWEVTVWDTGNLQSTNTSISEGWAYFRTTQAPTVTNLTPGSTDSNNPVATSLTPRLSWTFGDAEGHAQTKYFLQIFLADGTKVYDTGVVVSSNKYHDVPAGTLQAGVKYQWHVRVYDSTDMSTLSDKAWILTNFPPAPVTLNAPVDTKRVPKRVSFEATVGDDQENNNQHFRIQMATDSNFSSVVLDKNSQSHTGWEYNNNGSWFAISQDNGVASTQEGKKIRYNDLNTVEQILQVNRTYYWRIAPIDAFSGTQGNWSTVRSIRVGDVLEFDLKNPIVTSAPADRIVFSAVYKIAQDGAIPATLKVEATNNGLDASPTWEDVTEAFINGTYHRFTNTSKTATEWAVDVRVTIIANDTLGTIEFDGIGFSFD
ncbi:hypothetical protein ACLM5H_04875 [Fredinandcohnia humi]